MSMSRPQNISSPTERLDVDYDGIHRAAELLKQGGIVAFGTETVYGLGGISTSQSTVERIFTAKGRPSFNPLISHFPSAEAAFAQANMGIPLKEIAFKLAQTFWPGPLTLILPRHPQSRICSAVSAGLSSLAVRVPRGRAVQEVLRLVGAPVAAPSANRSGKVSPSSAAHVLDELDGRIDAVLNTGPCQVGVESTVLDLTGAQPILLRPGGITLEELEQICGPVLLPSASQTVETLAPSSPGQLLSHYAPSLPVRLNAIDLLPGEALLAFGDELPKGAEHTLCWNLSPSGNVEEAAQRLFTGLRYLDREATRQQLTAIAVPPLPTEGLGRALQDRLKRAAAPRPLQNTPPHSTAAHPNTPSHNS